MKSDAQLQRDVRHALAGDPALRTTDLQVTVRDGVVTLSGHPATHAKKLAAEHAASRVAGVRAVVVDLTVRLADDARRDDAELADAVRTILHWTVGAHDTLLGVQVENGWVTVTGVVEGPHPGHAALRTIAQMRGVMGVSDRIERVGNLDPDEIDTRIRAALLRHAAREAKQIGIAVKGDAVTLSGRIGSAAERDAVRGAAWSAPGVRAVVDDLVVEPAQAPDAPPPTPQQRHGHDRSAR
jgi:osmotically-inducible protein OsmY